MNKNNVLAKQIYQSLTYKFLTIALVYLTVPITLKYLGQENYGVWSTMMTILSWIAYFDLGIGNSLRNKIVELRLKNKLEDLKNLISTSYSIVGIISIGLFFTVITIDQTTHWQKIFNTKNISEHLLRQLAFITITSGILAFWLSTVNAIHNSEQKSELPILGQLITNLILFSCLTINYVFYKNHSIIYLAYFYSIATLTASILLTWIYFNKNRRLIPKITINSKHKKMLLDEGWKYFIIQISLLVIYSTDKIIITQIFGPGSVAQYDISLKLFNFFIIGYSLVANPLWNAYSLAYLKSDKQWLINSTKKQYLLFIIITIFIAITSFFLRDIASIWLHQKIEISKNLIATLCIFTILSIWNTLNTVIANSINKTKQQTFLAIITVFTNPAISIYLAKYTSLGISGVVIGTIISLIPISIIIPINNFIEFSKIEATPQNFQHQQITTQ